MNRFKFPGWPSVNTSIEMLASAISAGKPCACQSKRSPCAECRLAASMASIANLFRICEEMQKNLDEMDKQLDEAADLLLMQTPRREQTIEPASKPCSTLPDRAESAHCGEPEARLFLEWLRKNGIRETTARELTKLYAKYTVATNAPIVPENVIRRHLLSLDGVSKTQHNTHGCARRWHPTVWKFGQADEQSSVNMTTCAA